MAIIAQRMGEREEGGGKVIYEFLNKLKVKKKCNNVYLYVITSILFNKSRVCEKG